MATTMKTDFDDDYALIAEYVEEKHDEEIGIEDQLEMQHIDPTVIKEEYPSSFLQPTKVSSFYHPQSNTSSSSSSSSSYALEQEMLDSFASRNSTSFSSFEGGGSTSVNPYNTYTTNDQEHHMIPLQTACGLCTFFNCNVSFKNCGHSFHNHCLATWQNKANCPMCSKPPSIDLSHQQFTRRSSIDTIRNRTMNSTTIFPRRNSVELPSVMMPKFERRHDEIATVNSSSGGIGLHLAPWHHSQHTGTSSEEDIKPQPSHFIETNNYPQHQQSNFSSHYHNDISSSSDHAIDPNILLGLVENKCSAASSTAPKQCSVAGCHRGIRSRGLCKGHGGGRRCQTRGCGLSDQGGGFCIAHGGGRRCHTHGCSNSSQSRGLCKQHGGGSRCTVPNCTKSSQGHGLCRAHGGGKRCSVDGCNKTDRRGGLCASHGADRKCRVKECTKTGRNRGLCPKHFARAQEAIEEFESENQVMVSKQMKGQEETQMLKECNRNLT